MKEQHVVIQGWREKEFVKVWEDAFSYQPKKGWDWLQRLCFKFLKWRRCYHEESQSKISTYRVESENILTYIDKQIGIINIANLGEPSTILMGAKNFSELMGSEDVRQILSFDLKTRIGLDGTYRLMGLHLKIIPWMRGILVVPKL